MYFLNGRLRGVGAIAWIVQTVHFGVDGKPVLHKGGYAGWTTKYDERGNQIERAYFGVDGNPVLHKDGYAGGTTRYDERENQIERAYFGVDGNPVLVRGGCYAGWTTRYDVRGNIIEKAWFGVGNEPMSPFGFAREVSEYDLANGERLRTVHYDIDGNVIKEF